jgi:hypothetical protein
VRAIIQLARAALARQALPPARAGIAQCAGQFGKVEILGAEQAGLHRESPVARTRGRRGAESSARACVAIWGRCDHNPSLCQNSSGSIWALWRAFAASSPRHEGWGSGGTGVARPAWRARASVWRGMMSVPFKRRKQNRGAFRTGPESGRKGRNSLGSCALAVDDAEQADTRIKSRGPIRRHSKEEDANGSDAFCLLNEWSFVAQGLLRGAQENLCGGSGLAGGQTGALRRATKSSAAIELSSLSRRAKAGYAEGWPVLPRFRPFAVTRMLPDERQGAHHPPCAA